MTEKEPKPKPLTSKMEISNCIEIGEYMKCYPKDSVRSAYLYYAQVMTGAIQEGVMDKECGWFALQLLEEAFQAVSEDLTK